MTAGINLHSNGVRRRGKNFILYKKAAISKRSGIPFTNYTFKTWEWLFLYQTKTFSYKLISQQGYHSNYVYAVSYLVKTIVLCCCLPELGF